MIELFIVVVVLMLCGVPLGKIALYALGAIVGFILISGLIDWAMNMKEKRRGDK